MAIQDDVTQLVKEPVQAIASILGVEEGADIDLKCVIGNGSINLDIKGPRGSASLVIRLAA